ncbi:MAG: outer membrane protein assembly factor BamA [Pseudorhodoplanes sp.]
MKLNARLSRGLALSALILGGILFGSASVALMTADSAYAQVSSIVVQGNRRVEADTIRSYFKPEASGRLDAVSIDEGLKRLYATGLFQDVKLSQAGGRLTVTVVENPVINRIAFEGNKKTKDDQLTAEIQSKPRGTLSRPVVQADTQRLVEIYRRNGRFDVVVTPKIIELPNNRVDLVFEINEGVKTGVKTVNFVGNRAYSGYRLKEVIKTDETGLLSFLKNNDIFDPDRVEADRDLLRRFYLSRGYADVRVVSAVGEYDPDKKGFIVTYTIDEGERYRFGAVDIQSSVPGLDPNSVRDRLKARSGDWYNADFVEKSTEAVSIELSKLGYPFANVKPRGERDFDKRLINLAFVIEEGARAYIERINIRGNTRTRDYVIRREFDIAEGDAYNRALVDRAERRLKNINYFKTVKITNEPGSAPDRVVINVDVEEKSTGEFSIGGGYSTSDGVLGEISVAERNLLGRGQYAKASATYGSKSRGLQLAFTEPYFLGYRMSFGLVGFYKQSYASNYQSYDMTNIGGGVNLGFALREDLALGLRYSAYSTEITLPDYLQNCTSTTVPTLPNYAGVFNCYSDGEATLPVRMELAQGRVLTSLIGYTLAYNSLDNNKNPSTGWYLELKQDFAGVGGDVNFMRTTGDARFYYEIMPDLQSVLHVQAGHITGWGGKDLRMLDHFKLGPTLVRGFAPQGFGPRDLTPGTTQDALGGSMYWGASYEIQTPLYFLPKDTGLKFAAFVDAGSLWDYKGVTTNPATGEFITPVDSKMIRTSAGIGLIWDSPFGPLRFDYAIPITKEGYDHTQEFRMSGGTKF